MTNEEEPSFSFWFNDGYWHCKKVLSGEELLTVISTVESIKTIDTLVGKGNTPKEAKSDLERKVKLNGIF